MAIQRQIPPVPGYSPQNNNFFFFWDRVSCSQESWPWTLNPHSSIAREAGWDCRSMPPAQFCAVMETEPRVCAVHSQGLASELHPQPNMGHSRNSQNGLASGSFHCYNKRRLVKKKRFWGLRVGSVGEGACYTSLEPRAQSSDSMERWKEITGSTTSPFGVHTGVTAHVDMHAHRTPQEKGFRILLAQSWWF